MKGWSFNGLVKALKSAAFKDVGAAVGQVPLVGDNGLLSNPKNITSADFNNIDYKSGATLVVNPPYANWPFGSFLDASKSWYVIVEVGQGLSGDCVIRAYQLEEAAPVGIAKRTGASSWTASVAKFSKPLTSKVTPNALSNDGSYGDWFQVKDSDAATSLGYPIALAGTLSVSKGPFGVIQEYTTATSSRKYVRFMQSDKKWSAWSEYVRANGKQDCTLGNTSATKLTLPWQNAANEGSSVRKEDKDTIVIEWGSGTTQSSLRHVKNVGGTYTATGFATGWRSIFDGRARAPLTIDRTTMPEGAWVPSTAQTVAVQGKGYGVSIVTGAYLKSNTFASYNIHFAMEGRNSRYEFTPDGDLVYLGEGIKPDKIFLDRATADRLYVHANRSGLQRNGSMQSGFEQERRNKMAPLTERINFINEAMEDGDATPEEISELASLKQRRSAIRRITQEMVESNGWPE